MGFLRRKLAVYVLRHISDDRIQSDQLGVPFQGRSTD